MIGRGIVNGAILFCLVLFGSVHACNCNLNYIEETVAFEDETAFNIYQDLCESARLGDMEEAKRLYEEMKKAYRYFPKLEDCDDGSFIMSNFDPTVACEGFRKRFAGRMVDLGICDTLEDVELEGETLRVWPLGCKKKVPMPKVTDEDWCKDNCDTAALGLSLGCAALRVPSCVNYCLLTVEAMRRTCKYCCEGPGMWQRCLWPLQDYRPRCDCPSDTWW